MLIGLDPGMDACHLWGSLEVQLKVPTSTLPQFPAHCISSSWMACLTGHGNHLSKSHQGCSSELSAALETNSNNSAAHAASAGVKSACALPQRNLAPSWQTSAGPFPHEPATSRHTVHQSSALNHPLQGLFLLEERQTLSILLF